MPGLGNAITLAFTSGGGIVSLTIDYTATQFVFKFKLPSTKSITIHWGDGTTENVVGQDLTLITKTSAYSGAGTYYFYLSGDVEELTYIDIQSQAFVSGDVSAWSTLLNATYFRANSTAVSGDISGFSVLTSLTNLSFRNTNVSGDVSGLSTLTSATTIHLYNTDVTFDSTPAWSNSTASILIQDCGWTAQMVDNSLASFAGGPVTNSTINVAGTNAARTSASDADKATILANSNTLTVNE